MYTCIKILNIIMQLFMFFLADCNGEVSIFISYAASLPRMLNMTYIGKVRLLFNAVSASKAI